MENPGPHTLGGILLPYGLMIVRPSLLGKEILYAHVDIGQCIWRDILLLFDLICESLRSLVGVGFCSCLLNSYFTPNTTK